MDEIKRKLSDLGHDALREARKIKDTASLAIDIAAEEDRLKSHYIALGKLYYKLHAADPEEAMAEKCNTVEKSEKKLCHMRKQLSAYRGVARCEGCGKEIKGDTVFCPYCGKEVITTPELCD
ncbi:MAG: hypothetical protein IJO52_09040 [Clostridia bacterium]|nr:hypothetical protein [Clostridia bacterium]